MASSVAGTIASMAPHSASGSISADTTTGRQQGTGVKTAPGGPSGGSPGAKLAGAMFSKGQRQGPPRGSQQAPGAAQRVLPPQSEKFMPMIGLQAGVPTPHPGVSPPYPDARSPAPTLMPNGTPILPMPSGYPLAGDIPRVPQSFAPGAIPPIRVPPMLHAMMKNR